MSKKISYLLLEKSYVIRSGLMKILSNFPETGKIYEVENPDSLSKKINSTQTDVIIVNAKTVDKIKPELLKIKKSQNIKLVVFVGTKRSEEIFPGFDLKISVDEAKTDITNKIETLIKNLQPYENETNTEELSDREKEVVKQIALGKTNKEIGETLFISTHTVITHRKNITRKLGIKTVSGLTVYAILNNLIRIEDAV